MIEHRRDHEQESFSHLRESDSEEIPRWLKWTFVAINRVGFPVVAFFAILYIVFVSEKDMTLAINKQSLSLETLVLTVNSNHEDSKTWRAQMLESIRDVRNHLH